MIQEYNLREGDKLHLVVKKESSPAETKDIKRPISGCIETQTEPVTRNVLEGEMLRLLKPHYNSDSEARKVVAAFVKNIDKKLNMYLCAVCSFSSIRKRDWERHSLNLGHTLLTNDDEDMMTSLNSSFENYAIPTPTPAMNFSPSNSPPEAPLGDLGNEPSPPDDQDDSLEEEAWFPWKSKSHFYLTTLYHGSHRR